MLRAVYLGNRGASGRFVRAVGARQASARQAARDSADRVADAWRAGTRSARIARAVKVVEIQASAFEVSARESDVGFPPAVEERDTIPHVIVPRERTVLRFEKEGETVFARRVSHPGTTGSHALEKAVEEERPRYLDALRRVFP